MTRRYTITINFNDGTETTGDQYLTDEELFSSIKLWRMLTFVSSWIIIGVNHV